MKNCSTKRWTFPLYFHHYFYTHGKCPRFRRLFSGKLRSFIKNCFSRFNWIHYECSKDTALHFVCIQALSVDAISSNNVEQTNKKQDLETGKRRQIRKKTFFFMKYPHRTVNLQNDTLNLRPLTIQQVKLYHHQQKQTNKQQKEIHR